MTYNTLYQRHVTRVVCHWADLYIHHTRFCRLFCTSVKRDICDAELHSDKSRLSSTIQRRFPPVWKCNGLAVSKHVLYVLSLCMCTWREVRNFAWHRSRYVITHQLTISTLTDIFSLHWTLLFTTIILPDLFAHDSSAGWARGLFKPSKGAASLVVSI